MDPEPVTVNERSRDDASAAVAAPDRAAPDRRGVIALGVVAALWVLAQFVVTFRVGLGWDEGVYLSQFAGDLPAQGFSAPRARGVPLLVAPVVIWTSNVAVIRTYLTVLSGVLLFLGLWPWTRLRSGYTPAVAAALFGSVWVSFFYGNEAMPNMYVAYGALALVGLFALAMRPGRHRAATWGLFAVEAGIALVRPSDALWLAVPLIGAGLIVRRWRRIVPLIAVAAGVALGWIEWLAEGYVLFTGPLARLRTAAREDNGGLSFSLGKHLATLSHSSLLCQPTCAHLSISLPVAIWFFAIPLAAIAGCVVAWRRPQFAPLVLATVVAAFFIGSYVFTVGFAAPRFLLAYYALTALPVAELIAWLVFRVRGRARPLAIALVVVGLVGQAGILVRGMEVVLRREVPSRVAIATVGHELARYGVTPPCLVFGYDAAPIAYQARCKDYGTSHYAERTPRTPVRQALARGERVAVSVHSSKQPKGYLDSWQRVVITTQGRHWYFYVSPPKQ